MKPHTICGELILGGTVVAPVGTDHVTNAQFATYLHGLRGRFAEVVFATLLTRETGFQTGIPPDLVQVRVLNRSLGFSRSSVMRNRSGITATAGPQKKDLNK